MHSIRQSFRKNLTPCNRFFSHSNVISNVISSNTNANTNINTNNIKSIPTNNIVNNNKNDNESPSVTCVKETPLHYRFNTLEVTKRLSSSGFTQKQAETVSKVFATVLDASMIRILNNAVSLDEHSKQLHDFEVEIAKVKRDIKTLDRTDFFKVKSNFESIRLDVDTLNIKLKEDLNKLKAGVKLDISLEKGRMREESAVQELKIRETDTRIDTEMANVLVQVNNIKYQVVQWLIGIFTATIAMILTYLRLIS